MWKPLATHARDAGIPEPSARRYLASFKDWFQTRKAGKGSKTLVYGPQTPEILKAISEGFGEGKRRAEVEQVLVERFPQPVDVKPIPKDAPPPAQAPTSAPVDMQGLGQLLPVLIPLAERFLVAYEAQTKALQDIAAALAHNRPFGGFGHSGDVKGHGDVPEGQDTPPVNVVVDRQAVIARIWALHGEGLGQYAITTRLRREGLRLTARADIAKSTVARILKENIDAE